MDASPATSPLLHVDGLTVELRSRNGRVQPVRDISFDVDHGEVIGIVGESGSGKTLTALAIAQLLPYGAAVTARSLEFAGKELLQLRPRELNSFLGTRLAMVFQDPMSSLNPALRVGTQVIESARVHRRLSRRAALALARQRIEDVHIPAPERTLAQYPHEFSGGMRQRATIAMGLMTSPLLMIADEPTTALDVTVEAQVMRVLEEANRATNMAILLISHNIAVVAQVCTRILVMYAGRVVEDIATEALLEGARHPYTQALLASVPTLESDREQLLATIPGRPPLLDEPMPGCPFEPRCSVRVPRSASERPPLAPVPGSPPDRVACWVALDETTPSVEAR